MFTPYTSTIYPSSDSSSSSFLLGFLVVLGHEHEHEPALRVVLFHLAVEGLLAGELVAVQPEASESRQPGSSAEDDIERDGGVL